MSKNSRSVAATLLFGIALSLVFVVPARANQNWRPIRPADLALKDNPASPGSQAMILYREEYTDTINSFDAVYVRIKIFTAAGTKYGNVEIRYDKHKASIHDIQARTILPDGRVVKFRGKPYTKVVVKSAGTKELEEAFSLPDVRPGCIIEYKYRLQYDINYYWDITWDIQNDLFTREERFVIRPPISQSAPNMFWRTFGLAPPFHPVKQKNGDFAFVLHNVAPIRHESYMMPVGMVRGRVEIFFRQGRAVSAAKFWDSRAKGLARVADSFIDKKSELDKVVAQTVSPSDPPLVKLRKLYARTQQVRDTDDQPIGPAPARSPKLKKNHNVADLLEHGYGSGLAVNDLFLGLARAAGFHGNQVFTADRSRNTFRPSLEDIQQLTANIVLVRVGGRNLFFDPSSPDFPFGLLPWNEAAEVGLALSRKGAQFVKIPPSTTAQAVTRRRADLRLGPDGSLTGTLEVDFTGMRGAGIRQDERGKGKTNRRKDLSAIIQKWLPSHAGFHITSVTGWHHSSAPLRVKGTLKIPGYASAMGKRLLVPLVPFESPEARAFRSSTRQNAIYFRYPFEHADRITFHLPAGFSVESLPKPAPINGSAISFSVHASGQGDTLLVTRKLIVSGFYFAATSYPVVRNIFSTVKTDDDGQAVLETGVAAANR